MRGEESMIPNTEFQMDLTEEQRTNTESMMRALIEKMEQFIRQHPEQWVAFSPIWTEDIKRSP